MQGSTDRAKILICDLDNTLYDWVAYFVPSFYAMVDALIEITDWDKEQVLDEFHRIHQKYGSTEHPFSLLELESVQKKFGHLPRAELAKEFDSAFLVFNRSRKRTLNCYSGVRDTLSQLKKQGVPLIAYTDSNVIAVVDRLKRLELADYFSAVYCKELSATEHPAGISLEQWAEDFPLEQVVELSAEDKKPNPAILRRICTDFETQPERAAYVGDSLSRDIYMAKLAGVTSIWAKYGTQHPEGFYDKLVRVTHWTQADVAEEKLHWNLSKDIVPDYTLEHSFSELAVLFSES